MNDWMTRIGASILGLSLGTQASAQVTQRVSVSSDGTEASGEGRPSISSDCRYVAFASSADNLVPGDTNEWPDAFVRDRLLGTTERVSVSSNGAQGNHLSNRPSISADGRFVVFYSGASNLVPGDTNGFYDVFVRDRLLATTELVSVATGGAQGNDHSHYPSISADGLHVVFTGQADNLVPGDTNLHNDVFVHDRLSGTTERVSVDSSGTQGNAPCAYGAPSISGDGRYVAFSSRSTNLVPGDTNGTEDVYLRDRLSGTTERVSVDWQGPQLIGDSALPVITDDGRFVAFTNSSSGLLVRDRQSGTTELVIFSDEYAYPSLSNDGRLVGFTSIGRLVPEDTNQTVDVYVRDLQTGTIECVSLDSVGGVGNGSSGGPSISSDGRHVAFASRASNLVQGDTNEWYDQFVRDRFGGPNFTSLCDPGVGDVIGCPCNNPPSGSGRGCDNSSVTGGAILSASGGTYLSSDSLVFTTNAERPTALTIVAQWSGGSSTGIVYGMGVRCTSGTCKRLYTKSASGGSITAPNFGVGDQTVSARSAAKGDVILAGESRWYFAYYRDPNVLGGCPASGTFNATQTGQVTWSP